MPYFDKNKERKKLVLNRPQKPRKKLSFWANSFYSTIFGKFDFYL